MRALTAAGVLGTAAVAVFAAWVQSAGEPPTNALMPLQYTRLTNFPDSVHSPALSPDGKTLAFIRGPGSWEMAGAASDLYKKTLPDGNPIALTHDGTRKGSPTFTPDGSRIVFTGALMSRATGEYSLFSVPVEGGAPALFLRNASGLRWTGPDQLLFSETKRAPNMGIVAVEGTSGRRDVYVPASRTGMAHFSSRSPDGTHVLVVEMENAVLLPCRVVPFDGSSTGHVVGPPATECTSATWSPDGRWMYFSAVQNGESHLWRQRFPDGTPEQLTFGPNQESGMGGR
jgi:Tol biopolymer transport system component